MPWICGCGGTSEILGYVKREKSAVIFRKCQKCGVVVASHNLIISGDGRLRGKDLSENPVFKNFVKNFDSKQLLTFDLRLRPKNEVDRAS